MSNVFGGLADKIGARTMLVGGPAGAALAYVWMALGQKESLMLRVIVPMTLLGLSFAVLVAPLTASVMSSVGLASGINNAASRIAQLAGAALAAGAASFASGYEVGLAVAAATSIGGAFTAAITPTPAAAKAGGSGRASVEFNQIRYFLHLADTLNFTEAALRSGVSRLTLARARQRLEQELGGTLVFRDGKDSRLCSR